MDTEVTLDQTLAPSSTADRPAEEFSRHDKAAAIEKILVDSLDAQAKSSDATIDAPSLADGFAGIVYFATRTADRTAGGAAESQREPQLTDHRNAVGVSGGESVCSTRGRRIPSRPWRLPAVNRRPEN